MSLPGALGELELEALRQIGIARHFPRGTALFHQGQLSDRALLLTSGFVKLCDVGEDGREVVLAIRGPGDLLGELGVLDDRPRSATAIALDPIAAVAVAAGGFKAFVAAHPEAALAIISSLGGRLRDADRKRVEFAARDSLTRVAARILELAERFGEPVESGVRIELPISQEELAGWAGCSRDSVVKALATMRCLGWIETQRREVTIRALDAVRRQAA
jgi:CRP-like cAMP-binding protein